MLDDNKELLNKLFHKHATSAALSMIGVQACLMINSILAGKFFSGEGLAVMSVVSPIYSIYAAIGALTGIGGAIITAHSLGRDDKNSANENFSCALFVCIIISIFVSIFGLTFQDQFLNLLGSSEKTFAMSKLYSETYLIGGVFTALFYMPYHFLKLTGHLKALILIFLLMAITNGIFDYLFCVKMKMSMNGIALGTISASMITVLIGMLILFRDFKVVKLNNLNCIRQLFRFGTPSALNQFFNFARFVLMNNLLLMVAGHTGLVIFSVVKVIENLSTIILSGISQATSAFVGVFFEEKDNVSIRRIERQAHLISFELILILIVSVCLWSNDICNLFGIKDLYEKISVIDAIKIFSLSLMPSIVCMILSSYYQSTKFIRLANLITAMRGFILLFIPAYLLAPKYGVNMIWYSFTIAAIGTLIILAIVLMINRKENQSTILKLDLKSEKSGSYRSFSVKSSVEEISEAIKGIEEYCENNNFTDKETMLVKLSMEEMMISIKDHCFKKSNETMDARIYSDEESIVLRIRSGGKLFNPIAYYQHMEDNDPLKFALTDALGISMISKSAKEVHYKSTFGINNLTIVLDRS